MFTERELHALPTSELLELALQLLEAADDRYAEAIELCEEDEDADRACEQAKRLRGLRRAVSILERIRG